MTMAAQRNMTIRHSLGTSPQLGMITMMTAWLYLCSWRVVLPSVNMVRSQLFKQLLLCLFWWCVFSTTSTATQALRIACKPPVLSKWLGWERDYIEGKTDDNSEMVKYGDASYSLFQRPPVDSKVVQAAREKIAMRLDISAISDQLSQVVKFIRIAYNGLAMHSNLQGKVSTLAIRVTKLGDDSALTIANFQRASDKVLSALESTFWYIYHDEEAVARKIFSSVSSVAGDMANKAMELHQLYEQEVRKVEELLEATVNTKEHEEDVRVNLTLLMNGYEARVKRASQTRQKALAAFNNYEKLLTEARQRMYDAIDDQSDPWKKIANAFTSFIGVEAYYDFQAYEHAEEAYRQEQLKYLQEMEKQRKIKDEALLELEEFTHRAQACHDDAKVADITIEALQSTLGGLKMVAILMLDTATFWASVQNHMQDQQDTGTTMAVSIDELMKQDVAIRRELWQTSFKFKAINLYAQWVAIGSVCEESLKAIQPTLLELRELVKENPTREEALENIHKLAKSFKEDVARARKLLEGEPQKFRDEL